MTKAKKANVPSVVVKCVLCPAKKTLSPIPKEMPFCSCGGPMIARKVSTR